MLLPATMTQTPRLRVYSITSPVCACLVFSTCLFVSVFKRAHACAHKEARRWHWAPPIFLSRTFPEPGASVFLHLAGSQQAPAPLSPDRWEQIAGMPGTTKALSFECRDPNPQPHDCTTLLTVKSSLLTGYGGTGH